MPNPKYEAAYKSLGNDEIAKLELAVALCDKETIQTQIKKGVSPFASPKISRVNSKLLPPISVAISHSDLNAMELFLRSAKKPFDFTQRHPLYKSDCLAPMSWIQFAAIHSSRQMSEKIKEYQLRHFPRTDYTREINREFLYNTPGTGVRRTNVASLLFWAPEINHIATNVKFSGCEKDVGKQFLSKWIGLADIEELTMPFPYGAAVFLTALHQLEFLVDNGLNLKLQDHHGRNPTQNAQLFFSASKDPQLWESQIRPHLMWRFLSQTDKAEQHGSSILVPVTMKNLLGAHPVDTYCIPSYEGMRLLVDFEYAQSKGRAAPVLFSLQNKVSQHEEKLSRHEERLTKAEQNVEELQAEMAQLSEVQFNRACKGLAQYPFHCSLFKKLHKATESLIRQKGDASLEVFPALPSKDRMFAAEVVLGVFNIGAALSPVPYLQLVPGIASVALNCWNKHTTMNNSKAVFALELNAHIMATLISYRIVAECMNTYGTHPATKATVTAQNAHTATILDVDKVAGALFGKVKKQVNSLSTQRFAEPLEAVVFMCDTSLDHLRSVKEGMLTHSGSSSSDSPKFGHVSDSDSFGSGKHSSNDDLIAGSVKGMPMIGDKAKKERKSFLKRMGCSIQ